MHVFRYIAKWSTDNSFKAHAGRLCSDLAWPECLQSVIWMGKNLREWEWAQG